ncbi:MAG: DUF935 domain-containing protein [Polyangiales bacterium]
MAPLPNAEQRREIATTRDGRDITRGYVDALPLLPPQDAVLQLRGGGDYRIYAEVARDDQVKATFESRRHAVIAREWEVIPGGEDARDEEAAKFLREQLHNIRFDAISERMAWGLFYGFAVGEAIWAVRDNRVVLDAIRVRKQRRFGFSPEMELRLRTSSAPLGEAVPERKFWVMTVGADNDDEPYGLGLAHWLYWPVYFKRGGMRSWLKFLDKFAQPTAHGKYPNGTIEADQKKLLAALEALQSDSAVATPEGMTIDLLEAARSGQAEYSEIYDRMNGAISKVILGHSGAADSTPGRLGGEDQAADVRADLVKADADVICESLNRSVVRWLIEWNFPDLTQMPKVWRVMEEPEDLDKLAERDGRITQMGYRPTLDRIKRVYGDGYEPAPAPPTGAGAGASLPFAEAPGRVAEQRQQDDEEIDRQAETAAQD